MKGKKRPKERVNSWDFNSAGNHFTHSVIRPVLGLEWLKQEIKGPQAALPYPVIPHIGVQTKKNHPGTGNIDRVVSFHKEASG